MMIGNKIYLRPIVRDDPQVLNSWKVSEETFRNLSSWVDRVYTHNTHIAHFKWGGEYEYYPS